MRKIYVFDLDGTLVDSMPYFTKGILSILDDAGIPYEPELINVVTPLGYTKSAELYVTMGVKDDVPTIVKNIEKKLVREYSENVKLKAGVGEYLRRLHSKGARLFVLTASPHIVTDVCLKNNGVYGLFERVWSVEDFGMSKSDVTIFYKVADTIGCDVSEVNYFDDNLTAVTNSKRAGYFVYGIKDSQTKADTEKIMELSDRFVESFEDLLCSL
jgi:beta-phosphoglucomutase-like phosphatase (HAD superfamily)